MSTKRQCGGCTLCCKLLPTKEIDKPANTRCLHQRANGCSIYQRRPVSCQLWSCRWLVNDDTADLRRPDRSRYVIDMMPDFITVEDNDTKERTNIEVIQIWCDPKDRDAWKDEKLLAYLARRGEEGKAALIRWGSYDGATLIPPAMTGGGFVLRESTSLGREHKAAEIAAALKGGEPQK